MGAVSLWLAAAMVAVGQPEGAGSVRIAVVNVPAISEQYHRTADLETRFEAMRRAFTEERSAKQAQLDRAAKSLQEELKPGTAEFRERTKQLAILDAELRWFTESEGQRIEAGLATSLRSIFDDIQVVVHEIAAERGLDIVLASDQLPPEAPDSVMQARQHILLQKVLYWSSRVDLTNDVIVRLNAKHDARSGDPPVGLAVPGPSDNVAQLDGEAPQAGRVSQHAYASLEGAAP